MIDALVARAAADPEFATALTASARRVLDVKHAPGPPALLISTRGWSGSRPRVDASGPPRS